MQYYVLSWKSLNFIVTPEELRAILMGFHHVVMATGVRKGYVESDPNDFFLTYDALYQKLRSGEKLVWARDYDIASFSVGVTAHLENCAYTPGARLSIPNFAEPCPYIDTFCFLPWKGKLSTSFSVTQSPENVCGLCLGFPSKVEYEVATEKHSAGVVSHTDLSDFEVYETLVSRIKAITRPLKLEFNGKVHRTLVRISDNAKSDFDKFYFTAANNITVI